MPTATNQSPQHYVRVHDMEDGWKLSESEVMTAVLKARGVRPNEKFADLPKREQDLIEYCSLMRLLPPHRDQVEFLPDENPLQALTHEASSVTTPE